MIQETRLHPSISSTRSLPALRAFAAVGSMPGVFNLSVDELVKEAEDAHRAGVSSIIIFGLPESKDEIGSGAYAEDGITQRAIRALKRDKGIAGPRGYMPV
jgi:porphobilinogen synthase